MKSAEDEEKFKRGLAHFNAQEFFEAHEVWEEIWLHEREPEKTFLQGLIQLAAAFHHYRCDNPRGAESLLASGIVKLTRFPATHRGLALEDLRKEVKRWARALGEGKTPGQRALPRIHSQRAKRRQENA